MGASRCMVIPSNALSGITPTGETSETGYALANLTDDVMAKAWRSDSSASSFQLLIDRGASFTQLSWVGVFDLVAVTAGVSIKQVVIDDSPNAAAWTERVRFGVNSRGDGGAVAGIVQQHLRYTITTTGSTQIDIGLLVAGSATILPKNFTRITRSKDRGVVVNDTEGGGTYTGRLRSHRHTIALDWSALTEDQHLALERLEDDTGGEYGPLVLIPNTSVPGELYHGRFTEVQQHVVNPGGYYEGHALAFRESGRAL
jgi:hypothetical protein